MNLTKQGGKTKKKKKRIKKKNKEEKEEDGNSEIGNFHFAQNSLAINFIT